MSLFEEVRTKLTTERGARSLSFAGSAVTVAVFLPWLNPFAPGPSPAVVPWLFTFIASACLLLAMSIHLLRDGAKARAREKAREKAMFWWVEVKSISWAWLLAGVLSAILALLQYFGLTAAFDPWVNPTPVGEAFANLRQRNQFATLTHIALAALLWLAVQAPPTQAPTPAKRWAWLYAAACLLAVGNAISSSRTGLFQLLLLCGLYALWGHWQRLVVRRLLGFVVLVYALAMFAMPGLSGLDLATHGALARLGNEEACASRLVLWSNVLHLVAQKPWLGWGWGELDYAHFITLYPGPRFCDILDNAHNLPLQLAVELGVPLTLLLCGGFAGWVVRQKPWAERDGARQLAWAVMAVILLHSMLEYPLWYGPFQVAFGLCLMILWLSRPGVEKSENSAKGALNIPLAHVQHRFYAILIVALTACLAAAGYAAWDYHRVSQIYLQPASRALAYQDNTLAHAGKSWLFADQALFAQLMLAPLTPETAAWVHASATRLLHYSPEPRVVEKLVESAVMLGKDAEAVAYLARFKAAFPKEHAAWAKRNSVPVKDL